MNEILKEILILLVAVVIGVVLGNGAVFVFNKIPGTWLVDYDKEPDEELLHPTKQRVKSTPWKYVLTGAFIALNIKIGLFDYIAMIPVALVMFLMLLMAIADYKYMIVPDRLIILLAVSSVGFISYHTVLDMVFGLVLGLGVLLIMALISKLIYKTPGIGGADIKLFGALGLIGGVFGILVIFVVSTLLSFFHFISLLLRKKATLKDKRPMVPYITIATLAYLVLTYGTDFTFHF